MDASATIYIDRRPQEVFDFVMHVPNDAEWRTGVVEAAFTDDLPLGVGTRGFDRVVANRRDVQAEWEVYQFVAGRLARWNLTSGPIAGVGGYICEPEGVGTSFTLEARIQPTGAFRLMGPVFGMLGRRQNRRDVEKLKRILESVPVQATERTKP